MKKTPKAKSVLVLNGPNLNLLGTREPKLYGKDTLAMINRRLEAKAKAAGVGIACFQSNHEGVLVDRIQQAKRDGVDFILINPAGYSYSSVAMRDALTAVQIPFIEVHLSTHFTAVAVGSVLGLGSQGYELALDYAIARLKARS
jgi:3-dehydroquinate dehydratase-2